MKKEDLWGSEKWSSWDEMKKEMLANLKKKDKEGGLGSWHRSDKTRESIEEVDKIAKEFPGYDKYIIDLWLKNNNPFSIRQKIVKMAADKKITENIGLNFDQILTEAKDPTFIQRVIDDIIANPHVLNLPSKKSKKADYFTVDRTKRGVITLYHVYWVDGQRHLKDLEQKWKKGDKGKYYNYLMQKGIEPDIADKGVNPTHVWIELFFRPVESRPETGIEGDGELGPPDLDGDRGDGKPIRSKVNPAIRDIAENVYNIRLRNKYYAIEAGVKAYERKNGPLKELRNDPNFYKKIKEEIFNISNQVRL